MIAFLVVIAPLIGATGAADDGVPFFTRPEPSLEAAFEALSADDPDVAIERIHAAEASDDDERAIVEFDVGQALIARARKDVKDAAAANPKEPKKPEPPKLDDAIQSFERAATLAKNPRITSEAHLATGNASLEMQKIDEAIAAYRRAVVADLSNDRARRNLQRALELKNQQPPPQDQQQSGDGKSDDQKKNDGDKKDGEQGDQQKQQDGDKQDGDKKDGDQQQADQQKDGDKKEDDAKNDDDKDADGDKNDQAKKDDPKDKKDGQPDSSSAEEQKKKEEQAKKAAAAAKKKPTSKEEAKRLLQGLRSRERPLSPLEMRGEETQRPKDGKDW